MIYFWKYKDKESGILKHMKYIPTYFEGNAFVDIKVKIVIKKNNETVQIKIINILYYGLASLSPQQELIQHMFVVFMQISPRT